jgi:hypothetical protein
VQDGEISAGAGEVGHGGLVDLILSLNRSPVCGGDFLTKEKD